MRMSRLSGAVSALTMFGVGLIHVLANPNGGDDFSTDSGLWTSGEVAGAGSFAVGNGKLNYLTSGPLTGYDVAERVWTGSTLTYDEAWSVQVDLTIANFPSSEKVSAGLFVENQGGNGDLIRLAYFGGATDRRIYADTLVDGLVKTTSGLASSQATTLSLQLSFDPITKIVTAAYDEDASANGFFLTPVFTADLDSAVTNWEMTEGSQFEVRLRVHSDNLALSEGLTNFDNFSAVPEPSTLVATSCWSILLIGWCLSRKLRGST